VTSTIPIFGFKASVLFDSGATYSFVSSMFVKLPRLSVRTLEVGLAVAIPVGKTVMCSRIVRGCPITINMRILPANLVVLPLHGYNVILGMNWLAKHFTSIDCAHVMLKPWGETDISYVGSRVKSLPSVVSVIQARRLIHSQWRPDILSIHHRGHG
jgi:hypothetical protein